MNALLIIGTLLALGADPIIYQALGVLLMALVTISKEELE